MLSAICIFLAALAPLSVIGTPGDAVVGSFSRNLTGQSIFTESGANAQVYGSYRGLNRTRAYFTVPTATPTATPLRRSRSAPS